MTTPQEGKDYPLTSSIFQAQQDNNGEDNR